MSKTITDNSPLERGGTAVSGDGVCPSSALLTIRAESLAGDFAKTVKPENCGVKSSLSLQERETKGKVISEASALHVPSEFLTATAVIIEDSAKAIKNNITLVPKLQFGNSISGEASASLSAKPTLNIGLFGFGCVGQGLYDVLNHSQGLKASIGKICVKDKTKPRAIDMDYFTFNKQEVLQNKEHNLVVELTSDAEAALEIIGSSLVKGISVVTAGKRVLAENFELLYRLQQQTGASLLYEAACAGSIPIIRTLEEYYDNELLSSVKGILNGSSNYILSKMEFENLSYTEALKQAQDAGFAEADPALDVDGTDAKYKLCLLAAHAFGIIVKPEYILNSGIQNITPFDINYAAQNNCRIKLIAGIEKSDDLYRAYVMPRFVSKASPLSNINYEFNGIEVEGVYSDKQFFVGKGAGSHPTGSAVLSDISAITYDYKYGYKKLKKRSAKIQIPLLRGVAAKQTGCVRLDKVQIDFSKDHLLLESDFTIRLYIHHYDSHDLLDPTKFRNFLGSLDIQNIEEEYTSQKGNYVIANVGYKSLLNIPKIPEGIFLCVV